MSDRTRADEGEGREPGQDDLAARFSLEERTALVGDLSDLQACLSVDGRAHSSEIVARAVVALTAADDRAAQAEAEVARLTAAVKVSDKKAREVMLACLRAFRTSVMNDNAMPFSAFCTLVDDRMCAAARNALEAPHADN